MSKVGVSMYVLYGDYCCFLACAVYGIDGSVRYTILLMVIVVVVVVAVMEWWMIVF
jgi:hypothetical protein